MGVFTAILLKIKLLSIVFSKYAESKTKSHFLCGQICIPSFYVVIPAWNEGDVISNTIEKIEIAKARANIPVKIWVATYPNDYSTLHALQSILKNKNDINIIMNPLTGPTTKSQNLTHALLTMAKNLRKDRSKGNQYILVLDAEVYPPECYFEVLKDLLYYDSRVIYQTKVIAYPFTYKSLKERVVGQMYFVAQSYLQWFIDKPRRNLGKNIFLKGAGMIFPQDSIIDVIRTLETTSKRGFLSRYLKLADDLLISIELSKLGYKIEYVDVVYTLEEPPKRLNVVIKRYIRWFKANIAVLWYYKEFLLRYFLHNFVAKLSVAFSPIVYVGLVTSLILHQYIYQPVVVFNTIMSLYYLLIPPTIATLDEIRIPEIAQSVKYSKKTLLKEFSINLASNILNHIISPLVAIIGYYELWCGSVNWYKTERT